ncbi:unnamed protein product [Amoebophrya sp. A25]|nr:unnamed protein product [Amoebophrya sp. A25]|eukprot:GSA25T00005693001.1
MSGAGSHRAVTETSLGRWTIFCVFSFYYGVGGSYDLGAVTACLPLIVADLDLHNLTLSGFLGSVGYYGMFTTMPVFGVFFSRLHLWQSRTLAPGSMAHEFVRRGQWLFFIVNWSFLGLTLLLPMCMATSISQLIIGRFFLGVFQGAADVYYPVWIEEYAPPAQRTTWQGSRFVCIMLGVMLGYLAGGLLATGSGLLSWRAVLAFQGIASLAAAAMTFFIIDPELMAIRQPEEAVAKGDVEVAGQALQLRGANKNEQAEKHSLPSGKIDLLVEDKESANYKVDQMLLLQAAETSTACEDGDQHSSAGEVGSVVTEESITDDRENVCVSESFWMLFGNYNYFMPVFNLSCIFLIAQGVQFWSPQYLKRVFSPITEDHVIATTVVIIATGPAAGIFLGGKLIDYFGGYHNESGRIRTYTILCAGALISSICGIIANGLSGEPLYNTACSLLWAVLAVGAGAVGPLQGISISAIPNHSVRTLGNSVATVGFMVGASLGPLIPGFALQELCPKISDVDSSGGNADLMVSTTGTARTNNFSGSSKAAHESMINLASLLPQVQTPFAAGLSWLDHQVKSGIVATPPSSSTVISKQTSGLPEMSIVLTEQGRDAYTSSITPGSSASSIMTKTLTTLNLDQSDPSTTALDDVAIPCVQEAVSPLLCGGVLMVVTLGLCLVLELRSRARKQTLARLQQPLLRRLEP